MLENLSSPPSSKVVGNLINQQFDKIDQMNHNIGNSIPVSSSSETKFSRQSSLH